MNCYACGQPAQRSCTQCGQFYCPNHEGMRHRWEGAGKGAYLNQRALCNDCTPNQVWVFLAPLIILVAFGGLFYYLAVEKPRREALQQPPAHEQPKNEPRQARELRVSVYLVLAAEEPSREERVAEHMVKTALDAAGIGEMSVHGGKPGYSYLEYRVHDEVASREAIGRAMREHAAGTPYSVWFLDYLGGTGGKRKTLVSVYIPMDGEQASSWEESKMQAILAALKADQFGELKASGSERGELHFSYQVHDGHDYCRAIRYAIRKHMPRAQYRVRASVSD